MLVKINCVNLCKIHINLIIMVKVIKKQLRYLANYHIAKDRHLV